MAPQGHDTAREIGGEPPTSDYLGTSPGGPHRPAGEQGEGFYKLSL